MATISIYRPSSVLSLSRSFAPSSSSSICRCFSTTPSAFAQQGKSRKEKAAKEKLKKKRKRNPYYKFYNLKEMEQYTLCDAIQYLKAFEVGRSPDSSKYEAHVKLKTKKSGPVIRPNQVQLPYPVKSDVRFAVICPPDSKAAREAKEAGAVLVGEEDIFEDIKSGKAQFERLIAHPKSMEKIQKSGLPRILGPKGLMPNVKNGTISTTPGELLRRLVGGALYRERMGVIRMAVGQLGFTPDMLRDNLRAFVSRIKEDASKLPEDTAKDINEVVLSSTNGPGFSLNGQFRTEKSPPTWQLTV
ncbi:ribosomal protein L1 [Cyphellophora europaea CBS 101466]|uniref:Ribosomal protein L1 n=1 Tax=Cyphellophora europaea (strain CBS 101466) TaxID=1220924 RepID=W2RKY3_CYPE1|nr:ribosomal protein L1 [Cyphellophora europaea CBS 101466]ETN36369.1 ribosomal protein L1 [Cyphellophora europaea CBS 101466]